MSPPHFLLKKRLLLPSCHFPPSAPLATFKMPPCGFVFQSLWLCWKHRIRNVKLWRMNKWHTRSNQYQASQSFCLAMMRILALVLLVGNVTPFPLQHLGILNKVRKLLPQNRQKSYLPPSPPPLSSWTSSKSGFEPRCRTPPNGWDPQATVSTWAAEFSLSTHPLSLQLF